MNRCLALLLAIVMGLPAPGALAQIVPGGNLPDIGNPATTLLSQADEFRIGMMILRGLRDAGQLLEDPEINEYIQALGQRLASHAHEGGYRFTFFVVKDSGINAFALPGGFIGINAGLLTSTRSESELAGVLAHEIAHVTQRHIARSIQNAGRTNLVSAAAVLAAILIGAATGLPGDAIAGTVTAAQGLAIQQQIGFTRSNESEADRVGMTILASSGFDPHGMANFFWTMHQRTGGAGRNIPELLRTHPVTTERIAETRERALQYGQPAVTESSSYALMRERALVETMPPETPFRDLYRDAANADTPSTDGEVYGRALALMRAGAADEAIVLLRDLVERHPELTPYHTTLGQALLASGDLPASRAQLESAMELFPRNVPVTMRYAEVLMRAGDARRAHLVLLDLFNNVPPTPEQARTTAMAANAAGDTADAYYYMSEYHVIGGDLALAIDQLKLAQAVPELNSVQRERFEARIKELQEYLPKGRREREIAGPASPKRDEERRTR